jgi:hypothetical protein
MYTKETAHGLLIASNHVDDIICTAPNKKQQKWLERVLEEDFEISKQYNKISYLGMTIEKSPATGIITVTQEGYIQDIVKKYGYDKLAKTPKSPATDQLTKHDSELDKQKTNKKEYLSLIMSLMYPARLTRPDILMPVTYLATRCSDPTEADKLKAIRILKYLSGTANVGMTFTKQDTLEPHFYVDASHSIYESGTGHAGIIITLGSAPVLCRSYKIKTVTRSSSESELYALDEASTYVVWYKCLLSELGVLTKRDPIKVYQDNKSTIIMAIQGGTFKRTKHLMCKQSYVKERIKNGDMVLKYLTTTCMPADILTKPMSRPILDKHMDTLNIG